MQKAESFQWVKNFLIITKTTDISKYFQDGRSDCVHLEHSGKERRWSDVPCTAQMYALCQRV